VIVLHNWYHWQGSNTAPQIADRLATVVVDGLPAVQDPPSASQRKQLVGTYQADKSNGTMTATVGESKDGLTLRLPMQEPVALVPAGPVRLALPDVGDGFFARLALEGGKVTSLTLEALEGLPSLVLRPAAVLRNAVADFDKATADKVVGKVWLGRLAATPDGKTMIRIVFRFTVRDGVLTGVLDDADQELGILGVELFPLRLDPRRVAFAGPAVGARYEGTLSDDGKEIVGHWHQGGGKVPLRFTVVP
jgi:hypothetical protein